MGKVKPAKIMIDFEQWWSKDFSLRRPRLKIKIILWGPIDPTGTVRMGKGWAYGPTPSPRIRAYPRMISEGRNENFILERGKEYLQRT